MERITAPSKIIYVGQNYSAHAKEFGNPVPTEPVLFQKAPSVPGKKNGADSGTKGRATMAFVRRVLGWSLVTKLLIRRTCGFGPKSTERSGRRLSTTERAKGAEAGAVIWEIRGNQSSICVKIPCYRI